jgi:uncharacterized protein YecT (DUF1311 family)
VAGSIDMCLSTRVNGGNNFDMGQCLGFAMRAWERRVDQSYEHALMVVAPAELVERLRASQEAWLQWSNEYCGLLYDIHTPGTIAPIEAGLCRASHAVQRTFELESLIWWFAR